MRRFVGLLLAAGLAMGCGGKVQEPAPLASGKGDMAGQLDQLKTWQSPYVLVGQYSSCDQSCINTAADPARPDAIRGVSARCCTKFTASALTGQTLGTAAACPEGFHAVANQSGAVTCQVVAGGHTIYIPKECNPFSDNADDQCAGGSSCGIDGYCFGGTGREAIDSANQAARLHPDLKQNTDYHKFNDQLTQCDEYSVSETCGSGVDDVFASQWWPQSENGIAWRWQPSANASLADLSEARTLSPIEKYDLVFSKLSSSCAAEDKVTVAGRTFCPQSIRCGSNRCSKDSAGDELVSCGSDEAKYCLNYGWKDTQDGCPGDDCEATPYANELVKVLGPATKWEVENHGKYQNVHPDSWWGHCNGWASYATAEALKFPKEDICVRLDGVNVQRCTSDAHVVEDCGKAGSGTEGCMLFRMGDIEALMTEVYFSDAATFTGRRCNEMPEDVEMDEYGRPKQVECRDINAGTFHVAVTGMLGEGVEPFSGGAKTKLPFVIDHNWDFQVWNFPLVRFQFANVTKIAADGSNCPTPLPTAEDAEASGDTELAEMLRTQPKDRVCAARLVALNSNGDYSKFKPHASTSQYVAVSMYYWMVSDGVGAWAMMKRADNRGVEEHQSEMNYVLELDGEGYVRGGEWTKNPAYQWGEDNKEAHPDFLWAAIKPSANSDDTDLTDADNRYVNYHKVKALLLCANDATSCGGTSTGGGTGGGTTTTSPCAGHCGGQADSGCWCNANCANYGDCCQADGSEGGSYDHVASICD